MPYYGYPPPGYGGYGYGNPEADMLRARLMMHERGTEGRDSGMLNGALIGGIGLGAVTGLMRGARFGIAGAVAGAIGGAIFGSKFGKQSGENEAVHHDLRDNYFDGLPEEGEGGEGAYIGAYGSPYGGSTLTGFQGTF